jgi:hypothetical protein
MWNIFSKFFSFFFVLIVIVVIYLVFFAEQGVQQDVLKYSLNLVGERFFELVPEGPGRAKLRNMYDSFKQQALKGEIDSDRVEHVVANILNVSNNETPLTTKQAEGVLQSALLLPQPAVLGQVPPPPPTETVVEPTEREVLGNRIKMIFDFNETMVNEMKKQKDLPPGLPGKIHYCIKNGLKVELDDSLKFTLHETTLKNVTGKLNDLEKMKLIEWRQNLAGELEKERQRLQIELKSIQKSLRELENEKTLSSLEYLESLDSLILLKNMPIIDTDSLRKLTVKNLEAARKIQPEKNK